MLEIILNNLDLPEHLFFENRGKSSLYKALEVPKH